jgi:O-succinylbenzoate synthase
VSATTSVASFSLPLSITLRGEHQPVRRGVFVRTRDHDTGALRFSEASPLPGFSTETLDDVWNDIQGGRFFSTLSPSLTFARAYSVSDDDLSQPEPPSAVLITDLADVASFQFDSHLTVKLKVSGADPDAELAAVRALSGIIRLDGNRQLSVAHTHALAAAAGAKLQWFEEPVLPALLAEIDPRVPIAADEAFRDDVVDDALLQRAVAWVLKPTLLGAERTAQLQADATARGKPVVISSAFESAIGRCALAKLCAPGVVHGLGTGRFFRRDANAAMMRLASWTDIA